MSQSSQIIRNMDLNPVLSLLQRHGFELCLSFFLLLSIRWYSKSKNKVLMEWPVLGVIPSFLQNVHRVHEWTVDISKMFGMTIFLTIFQGSKIFLTCDPRNVEYILKTNFYNFPKGSNFQEIFDVLGKGIFTVDSQDWHAQRKMAHSVLSPKEFRIFISSVSEKEVYGALIPLLIDAENRSSVIDMQEVLLKFTLDSIFPVILGENAEHFAAYNKQVNDFVHAMDDLAEVVVYRLVMPRAWWRFCRLLNIGNERKLRNARNVVDTYLQQCISSKRKAFLKGVKQVDLIATYMASKEVGRIASFPIDDKFLQDTVLNFLFAGRDTTSSGISWLFWLIATTPRVEANILNELKLNVYSKCDHKGGRSSWPWIFSSRDLKGLLYLDAAVYESLRLYPPLPINFKGAERDDVLPDGNKVKSGMKILFSMYAMARMECVWGKDCLEFKPERWIAENGTSLNQEALSKLFSFNIGPRTCIGKDMALTQIKLVVAAVFFNFHVELVEGHIVSPRPSSSLQMKNGLMVRIKKKETQGMETYIHTSRVNVVNL